MTKNIKQSNWEIIDNQEPCLTSDSRDRSLFKRNSSNHEQNRMFKSRKKTIILISSSSTEKAESENCWRLCNAERVTFDECTLWKLRINREREVAKFRRDIRIAVRVKNNQKKIKSMKIG